jgi:hypothetical protein
MDMKKAPLVMAIVLSLAVAVTVQSAARPTGTLKVPQGLSLELTVNGKPALVPTGRAVPLPVGKYEPASLTCGATAPGATGKPDLWTIKCAGGKAGWGKIAEIPIEDGAATTVDAGPPFTVKTIIYKPETPPTGKVVPLTIRIFGKAGELYDLNTLKRGLTQAPQLALQIVDEKGTVLATGTLPYG